MCPTGLPDPSLDASQDPSPDPSPSPLGAASEWLFRRTEFPKSLPRGTLFGRLDPIRPCRKSPSEGVRSQTRVPTAAMAGYAAGTA